MDAKEVLAELAQPFDEAFGLVLGPLLVDALGHGTLD